jgi:hypothetical protein
MPRAPQSVFKIPLYFDRAQSKIYDSLERQTSEIMVDVLREAQGQLDGESLVLPESFVLKSVMDLMTHRSSAEKVGLTEFSIRSAIRDAYSKISSMSDSAKERRRGRRKILVEVPSDEVIFSTLERLVRVPYLGLIKHASNVRIISDPGYASDGKKAESGYGLRRTFLGRQNSVHFLLLDHTEEGDERAVRSDSEKRRSPRRLPKILE